MKLLTKLTLFATISKAFIVLLFILLLPSMVNRVASDYTNYLLKQQENKVFSTIQKNGLDYYLAGDSSYGSYTMLKEEYISLEYSKNLSSPDTLLTSKRIIEGDTLTYRLLIRNFEYDKKWYTLEIGKSIAFIGQYNRPLQRIALYVLIALVLLTLIIDLSFTRVLLLPLKRIIRSKLMSPRFPFNEKLLPIRTSTTDFRYLDQSLIDLMHQITADFERERAFTSNASHELMTPLGILQNKLENLMLATEDPETLEKISALMKTLGRLKKIVHALLLISRIENNQYNKQDSIHIDSMFTEMIYELNPLLKDKNIALHKNLQPRMTITSVNKELVFQVFYNLLTNAIRYNKTNGRIFINDEILKDGSYVITVEDNGVGIPNEELLYIFDRFKKSNRPHSQGNGLGLSIVKSIVEFHALGIKVSSVEGNGSVFSVIFPISMLKNE
ncbi:MAG: HAMP domain-containing sensor histidine kinase [Agriterribacter sp.]